MITENLRLSKKYDKFSKSRYSKQLLLHNETKEKNLAMESLDLKPKKRVVASLKYKNTMI